MEKDYYKILGVPRRASQEEVKSAYLKYSVDATNKRVNIPGPIMEAFEVLSDKKKRQDYDESLPKDDLVSFQDHSRRYQYKKAPQTRAVSIPQTRTLHVGNLRTSITEDDLKNVFAKFGPTDNIVLKMSRSGRTAYAFVKFFEPQVAESIMREFNGKLIGRLPCKLNYADDYGDMPGPIDFPLKSNPVIPSSSSASSSVYYNSKYRGGASFHPPDHSDLDALANQFKTVTLSEQPRLPSIQMMVAQKHLTALVGKKLWRKKEIEEETGTRISFRWEILDQAHGDRKVPIRIQGEWANIEKAKKILNDYIRGRDAPKLESVFVPRAHFKLLRHLKRTIRNMSGCNYINFGNEGSIQKDDSIPVPPPPNLGEKFEIKICGNPAQVQAAIKFIQNRIGSEEEILP